MARDGDAFPWKKGARDGSGMSGMSGRKGWIWMDLDRVKRLSFKAKDPPHGQPQGGGPELCWNHGQICLRNTLSCVDPCVTACSMPYQTDVSLV